MANVAYITSSQLSKIREQVKDHNAETTPEENRRTLKAVSDDRAARWPNTLSIDRQETEMRAEQRRAQIERANKILFDETDRVKGFHSAMLVSDVLHENNQLVGYKRQIDVLRKAQEAAYVEQQKQMADAAELRKLEATAVHKAMETKMADAAELRKLEAQRHKCL
eukprot:gene30249-35236_t